MTTLSRLLRSAAQPLAVAERNHETILEMVGDAPLVLLGSQTHGSHEFYRIRAEITQRLIEERGFNVVALEADWPDAYRVNRYVRGLGHDSDANSALSGFQAFPSWLWRNADMLDFVGWLKAHNDGIAVQDRKIGVYGIDLYSLQRSIYGVISFLEASDPALLAETKRCYECFAHYDQRGGYRYDGSLALTQSCEDAALREAVLLRHHHAELISREGPKIEEDLFSAEQNAVLVQDAERFYRAMFSDRVMAWNQRDAHMARVVQTLLEHFRRQHPLSKIVVWAHNSHVGDERARQHRESDRINMGQLVRERYGQDAVLVGFTTYQGTVTAAQDWWESPHEQMPLAAARADSHEEIFHRSGWPALLLDCRKHRVGRLADPREQRSVGVVYRPEDNNCYSTWNILDQFDIVMHLDHTRAVEPLEEFAGWDEVEMPETFPTGI